MPQLPIPHYDLQAPSGNTFELRGMMQAQLANGQNYFRRRREPLDDGGFSINYADDAIKNDNPLYIESSFHGDVIRTFIVYEQNRLCEVISISPTQKEIRTVGGLPDRDNVVFKTFAYRGIVYVLSDRNELFSLTGGEGTNAEIVTTSLAEVVNDVSSVESPSHIAVWLDRIWISYGRTLIWSQTGNPTEWRTHYTDENNVERETNAGFQVFAGADEITGLGVSGNHFYLFLDNEVHKTEAYESGFEFGFIQLISGISYIGGAVGTRAGLLFFTESGLYALQGDQLTKLSENIDPRLIGLQDAGSITSAIVGDDVFWCFRDFNFMIAFNIVHQFANIVDADFALVGHITADIVTIDELTDPIDSYTGTLTQVVERKTIPIAYFINDADYFRVFGYLPEISIRFNLAKNRGMSRVFIHNISVPDLELNKDTSDTSDTLQNKNYAVRIKDGNTNNWGEYWYPDRWGEIPVRCPYVSPDIDIIAYGNIDNHLTSFFIKFTERGR